jgi:hypothetical protein
LRAAALARRDPRASRFAGQKDISETLLTIADFDISVVSI